MREIKFRVWYEGKMHYNAICGNGQALFILDGTGEYKWISIAECKVMQFTGRHDKNGKEVYEDDFLIHPNTGVFVILYDEFGFNMFSNGFKQATCNTLHMELIGNIDENPELITALNGKEASNER